MRAGRVSRRGRLLALAAGLLAAAGVIPAEREFRVYHSFEGDDAETELPADYKVPGEFVVGRLMYPSGVRMGFFGRGDWRQGGTSWAVDYPRGDRTLARMLRRFTRTDVRSVDYWQLTDSQAAKLREYLLRGGFLFCDSFFGSESWVGFEHGLKRIFPDRPIVDLADDDPVFHSVYDLPNMTDVQIPNMYALRRGGYLGDGRTPRWRGIVDDDGRLMVLIAFNNDVADGWQWADDVRYPGESANLALRIGVNIAIHALTH
jgi:hypothetical protein